MEFFKVVAMEGCPTTSPKVAGLYFLADTMNLSICDVKDSNLVRKVKEKKRIKK